MHCGGGGRVPGRGVPALGGVPGPGGCLVWGVSALGGVPGPRGVPGPGGGGGCLVPGGVC